MRFHLETLNFSTRLTSSFIEDPAGGRPCKVEMVFCKLCLQVCDFTGWEHVGVGATRGHSRHSERPSRGESAEVFHCSLCCSVWDFRSGWVQYNFTCKSHPQGFVTLILSVRYLMLTLHLFRAQVDGQQTLRSGRQIWIDGWLRG